MRLRKLHLRAFGPFTDRILDFGDLPQALVVVCGPNEAGKSSALRAISDLRFGIPTQSKDDFIHAHPQLRIGGEFIDRTGKLHSLMRRKGRNPTLHLADFLGADALDQPAAAEIEVLLTCGLTKLQHDSMFGIDHRRLRDGGEALLKGDGEVGAALFEASAGVRSVPDILERLDGAARKHFIPGGRGKNAKINEGLAAYDTHQTAFKRAQVRPSVWSDLYKKAQQTATAVVELEIRWQAIHINLLMIGELRAVSPVMATLDTAAGILDELKDVPLLSTAAAAERAAAEAGLADAQHNAQVAADDRQVETRRLEELSDDVAVLKVGPSIRRFAAAVENIDRHQHDSAMAKVQVDANSRALLVLADKIAPALDVVQVLERAPSKAKRAEIERLLRAAEEAQRSLDQHREAAKIEEGPAGSEVAGGPSAEAKAALGDARAAVNQAHSELRRLAALPGEIKSAQRTVAQVLATLSLTDEAEYQAVRPLLNAQIDAALNCQNGHRTQREELDSRIQKISEAMGETTEQRDQLLAEGAVPTRAEVAIARALREASWRLVRDAYVDRRPPVETVRPDVESLPDEYEHTVLEADRLMDAWASDTKRAAELEGCLGKLNDLERDRTHLVAQVAGIATAETLEIQKWNQGLETALLPALTPVMLREWQGLLPAVRAALESLHAKQDECEQCQQIEVRLANQLRVAVLGTGMASPGPEMSLSTLGLVADGIENTLKQRQTATAEAVGAEAARARRERQWSTQEIGLKAKQATASDKLRSTLGELLLPPEAILEMIRAQLVDLEELSDLNATLIASKTNQALAEQELAHLALAVDAICTPLGNPMPTDLRLYSEQVLARLEDAERTREARNRAQQAVHTAIASIRHHEATAVRHKSTLDRLCQGAAVQAVHQLPEAEDKAQRKRVAQDSFDRTREQLALASKRSQTELRGLIADRDAAAMDIEEMALTQAQTQIDQELIEARNRAEMARQELNAIDNSDIATVEREGMEQAVSSVQASMKPWIRSKIAHSLLAEALRRFRDRAQGPMLTAASRYFERMTGGRYVRLVSDDSGKEAVLVALRGTGARIHVEEMSEGTRDQLYLALRLSALDFRRQAGVDLPIILDDILITSDEDRSALILQALSDAAQTHQVIVFTHHQHIINLARGSLPSQHLHLVDLE